MKRISLLLLLVCIMGIASQAQVTNLPEGFTSNKAVWIVRAGIGFSGASGEGMDAIKENWEKAKPNSKWSSEGEFRRVFGGNASFGFTKNFANGPVYWGMDLGMSMRGYETEASWDIYATSSVSGGYDSHYKSEKSTLIAFSAQLTPINIGYRYIINDKMAVDVHVGGFASYDFAGKLETETRDHIFITGKYGTNNKTTDKENSVNIGDIDSYRNFDFGVIGGIGFWFGHFNIDVSYQQGFVSMYDSDKSLTNNKLQARLGYAF